MLLLLLRMVQASIRHSAAVAAELYCLCQQPITFELIQLPELCRQQCKQTRQQHLQLHTDSICTTCCCCWHWLSIYQMPLLLLLAWRCRQLLQQLLRMLHCSLQLVTA
jgi:hypothetical protein